MTVPESLTRRSFVAGGACLSTAILAGCTTVINAVGGHLLADVNVLNATDHRIAGSIEVLDPGGDLVLDEGFDLLPSDDDGTAALGDGEDSSAAYEDVLTRAGTYTVSVELAEGGEIDGETSGEDTLDVTDVDDEHVAVALGVPEAAAPIEMAVVEEFLDLRRFHESD